MRFILLVVTWSCLMGQLADAYSLHFVTYNVKDNLLMPNYSITPKIASELLFPHTAPVSDPRDIYVVALQENCFNCDSKNLYKVAKVFLKQLQAVQKDFVLVGQVATRDTNFCEKVSCNSLASLHGTSVIMVFSKERFVKGFDIRKRTKCMTGYVRNSEKGLAGLQLHMENGKKLCFVAGHLDAGGMEGRMRCIADYFGDKKSHGLPFKKIFKSSESVSDDDDGPLDVGDSNSFRNCNSIFLAGDFNTRTGKKNVEVEEDDDTGSGVLAVDQMYSSLVELDEFAGSKSYTGQSLLEYLRNITKFPFKEPMRPFLESREFAATYSLVDKSKCGGQGPCYNRERPISWTDRIACYNCGEVKYYSSLSYLNEWSDHLPVIGVFDQI